MSLRIPDLENVNLRLSLLMLIQNLNSDRIYELEHSDGQLKLCSQSSFPIFCATNVPEETLRKISDTISEMAVREKIIPITMGPYRSSFRPAPKVSSLQ